MFKRILMMFLLFSIYVYAETTGEVDNYEDLLNSVEQSINEEQNFREKLDKNNKEIVDTASQVLKILNREHAPNLILEDSHGNKTILRVDEESHQIIETRLTNKSLFPKDETIDTSTNIRTARPHSLNDIIYVISGILYIFASGYLLAVAVGKALSGGYGLLLIDLILWLFLTSLMAKILGYL